MIIKPRFVTVFYLKITSTGTPTNELIVLVCGIINIVSP